MESYYNPIVDSLETDMPHPRPIKNLWILIEDIYTKSETQRRQISIIGDLLQPYRRLMGDRYSSVTHGGQICPHQ